MFPYIGGKSHHVKWIEELFPQKFDTYVEVFGGAGWVLVKTKKLQPKHTIIYNDLNPFLANVFECFRQDSHKLKEKMDELPTSNADTFRQFQRELFVELDTSTIVLGDIELAVKYLYLQTQIFSGTALSAHNVHYFCDVKSDGKYHSKYETLKNKLVDSKYTNRLSQITRVESLDFRDLIEKYDSKSTFFYCDPPYHSYEKYYSQDFPKEQHETLAETLKNVQGKFALSYYEFEDLYRLYDTDNLNFHKREVYRSSATRSSHKSDYSKRSKGEEILVRNYENEGLLSNLYG